MTPNTHFFDRYSIPHVAVGALMQASRVPPAWAMASHVAFEASENSLKRAIEPLWPDARPDAWQNQVGDVVSFAAGYYGARALSFTPRAGRWALVGVGTAAAAIWFWSLTAPERQGGWQHT
jgi:hypothetical protein